MSEKQKKKPALTPKKGAPPVPVPDTSWHPVFLRALSVMPNVRLAAKAAGVSRQDAYKHREAFPEFAEAWDEAKEAALDQLELTLFQRAKKQSDTLGIFFLKAHRPEIYRDKIEVKVDLSKLTDEELIALEQLRAKLNS